MMESTERTIGRIFKERREQLGRSLQDAADATRIRKNYLESLENNRFSELPGRTYVMGFIRVYAAYLGLNSNPLVTQLNDLQSDTAAPLAAAGKPGLADKHAADTDWQKFFFAFLLVLVLGGLLYYLLASDFSDAPVDDTAQGTVSNGAKSAEPDQPLIDSAPAQAETAEPRSAEYGRLRSQAADVLVSAGHAVPPVAAEQQHRDGRNLPAIPPHGASLRMLALTDSSLIIKVDARTPQQYKLYNGLDLTWRIKQNVSVEFAARDVARFWLNGTEIDIVGDKSFVLESAAE